MPTAILQNIYEKVERIEKNMVTKEELNSILETVEIMSNPKTMNSIKESERDIKEGRVKEVSSVQDMIDELDK